MAFALMPALAFAVSEPSTGLLAQWKQALSARMRFEALHPMASQIFQGKAPGDLALQFVDSLRGPIWATDSSLRGWNLAAQALALQRTQPQAADALIADLAHRWTAYPGWIHEALLTVERGGAQRLADSLRLSLRRGLLTLGYTRAPEMAMTSLWSARLHLDQGRIPEAFAALSLAAALDPTCPWVPWLRLQASLQRDGLFGVDLGEATGYLVEAFGLMRYYDNLIPFVYNALHWLRLGLTLFGFVCLLVLLGRYYTRLTHPGAEKLPGTVTLHLRYTAIGLVLASVLLAGVGFGIAALAALPWLWLHANRSERRLLKWMLVGLVILPPALTAERALLGYLDPDKGIYSYHQAYASGFDPAIIKSAEIPATGNTEDSQFRKMAISLQYKKLGNSMRALETLPSAAAESPVAPLLGIHRANLALLRFDYSGTEKLLSEVQPLTAGWLEFWFNASQAALFQNNSARHKQYLDKAALRDSWFLSRFLEDNDALFSEVPPNRRAMDPMPRPTMLFGRVLRDWVGMKFLYEPIPGGLISIPGWVWLLACAAAWVGILLRGRYNVITRGKVLFECKICGKVMCRACRKGVHCDACFKTVSGISEAKMRFQLIQRLRGRSSAFSSVLFRGLNALFPGSGWLFLGQGSGRNIWILAASMVLALVWQMRHLVMEYPAFTTGVLPAIPWGLLIGLYAASLLASLMRRKDPQVSGAGEGAEVL